jgi:hypothetical protein
MKITKEQLSRIKEKLPNGATMEDLVNEIKKSREILRYDRVAADKQQEIISYFKENYPCETHLHDDTFSIYLNVLSLKALNFLTGDNLYNKFFNIKISGTERKQIKITFSIDTERRHHIVRYLK